MISNSEGNFCKDEDILKKQIKYKGLSKKDFEKKLSKDHTLCVDSFFYTISLINRKNESSDVYQIMTFTIFLVGVMVLLQAYRYWSRKLRNQIDENIVTADDFSIFVQNITLNESSQSYDDDLKKFFTYNSIENRVTPVADVVLCYDLKEFQQINDEKKKLIAKKQKYIGQKFDILTEGDFNNQVYKMIKRDILNVSNEIAENQRNMEILQKKYVKGTTIKNFIGKAFIIYNSTKDHDDIVKQLSIGRVDSMKDLCGCTHSKVKLFYNKKELVISKAQPPTDIIWENLIYSRCSRLTRLILSVILCVILQFVTLASIAGLKQLSKYTHDQFSGFMQTFIPLTVGIAIAIVNAILSLLINLLVVQQKHYDLITQRAHQSIQTAFFQFFNTACVVLVISYYQNNLFTFNYGLIGTESIVFITNALIPQLMIFLDLGYIITTILRKYQVRQGPTSLMTQKQANKLFQDAEFDLGEFYAKVGYNMIFFCLYFTFIPFSSLMMLISVILQYFLYKQQLVYRSSYINYIQDELNNYYINIIEFSLLLLTVGKILLDYWIFDYCHILNWINLGLAFVYFCLPNEKINACIFPIKNQEEERLYSQYKFQMNIDYDSCNPATKYYAVQKKHEQLKTNDVTKKIYNSFNPHLQKNQELLNKFNKI